MDDARLKRIIALQERLRNACQARLRQSARSLTESYKLLEEAEVESSEALKNLRPSTPVSLDELERRKNQAAHAQQRRREAQIVVGRMTQERELRAQALARSRAELQSLEMYQERQEHMRRRAAMTAEQREQDDQNTHRSREHSSFRKTGS